MSIAAGRLRHKVTIQRRVDTQDSNGDMVTEWETVHSKVPASIEPLSAREFIAASANQSQIVARIVIRHISGLDASMRIVHGSTIYNPAGFLPDLVSGREYLTIPVTTGVNEG